MMNFKDAANKLLLLWARALPGKRLSLSCEFPPACIPLSFGLGCLCLNQSSGQGGFVEIWGGRSQPQWTSCRRDRWKAGHKVARAHSDWEFTRKISPSVCPSLTWTVTRVGSVWIQSLPCAKPCENIPKHLCQLSYLHDQLYSHTEQHISKLLHMGPKIWTKLASGLLGSLPVAFWGPAFILMFSLWSCP